MDSLSLSGRVGIVTGGARGIGGAISTLLATDGATVAVLGLPEDRDRAHSLAARLNGAASRIHFYQGDVSAY
ncbi:MAG: SDR family NAD(P)-dependent oxidoreductase, partial [Candidatus Cybelea sp.]